jgi:hypothetical protein
MFEIKGVIIFVIRYYRITIASEQRYLQGITSDSSSNLSRYFCQTIRLAVITFLKSSLFHDVFSYESGKIEVMSRISSYIVKVVGYDVFRIL